MTFGLVWAAASPSAPPSPPAHVVTSTGTTAVQVWTLIVAGLAVLATLIGAWLLRRTGKGQVQAARDAARASERSAVAAEQSARAAQESVGVNRDTSAGVAQRAEADALAKRYQDAAAQLGHNTAPVRLAGVYAMALLADDWSRQRQQCVDVLCAYLRMPLHEPWAPDANRDERQVRRAIVLVIGAHLLQDAGERSWSGLHLDLSGAEIEDLQWTGAVFETEPRFRGARFHGHNRFDSCEFKQGGFFHQIAIDRDSQLVFDAFCVAAGHLSIARFDVPETSALILKPAVISKQGHWIMSNFQVDGHLTIELSVQHEPAGLARINVPTFGPKGSLWLYMNPNDHGELEGMQSLIISDAFLVPGAKAEMPVELHQAGLLEWKPKRGSDPSGIDWFDKDATY